MNTDYSKNSISWKSPSNIALIKYWGKIGNQVPANPSLSFTLEKSFTETTITYLKKETVSENHDVQLLFEGKENISFEKKIKSFFQKIDSYFDFLKSYSFIIDTSNSFPHSSGIASSASGMSALALCLCSIEEDITGERKSEEEFFRKASLIARLGSGSACRSVYGGITIWGASEIFGGSNEYAIPYPEKIHPIFKTFQDTILIVEKGAKTVSSSAGHALMFNHPFADQRFEEAKKNLSQMKAILQSGDLDEFTKIVEGEALMLHAMMMTSRPYYMLFKPNTINIIQKVWDFRNKNKCPLVITLDAGANVHLLYPDKDKEIAEKLIQEELIAFCENNAYICDNIGSGPIKV